MAIKFLNNAIGTSATFTEDLNIGTTDNIIKQGDDGQLDIFADSGFEVSSGDAVKLTISDVVEFTGTSTISFGYPNLATLDTFNLTAGRNYTLPNEAGTIALIGNIPTNNNQLTNGAGYTGDQDLSGYLPLTAGVGKTLSGGLYMDADYMIYDNRQNQILNQSSSTVTNNRTLSFGNATYSSIIIPSSNVGIGTTSPARGVLEVRGDFETTGSGNGQLAVISKQVGSDPTASDVGGQMVFGGPISASDSERTFGSVGGYKENGTSGDRSGYLSFGTRQNTDTRDIVERIRVTSAGNVGIGTTSPTEKLVVQDGKVLAGHTNARGYGFHDLSNYTYTANTGRLSLISNGTEAVSIDSSQRVGIGTTSPSQKLDVAGNISVYNGYAAGASLFLNHSNQYSSSIIKSIADTIDHQDSGSSMLRFYTNDNSTTSPTVALDLTSESNAIFYGNVGIGTTGPSEKLEVYGKVSCRDKLLINGADYNSASVESTAGHLIARVDTFNDIFDYGNQAMHINDDNVGIGTAIPTSKLDVTNGAGKFCVDSKTHNLTNVFTTCLTVNLNSHAGCYVTLTCFGDWGSHSAAAYRGEFFLQNGANSYNEPGIILRQDDNTSDGTDQIVCQIVDPAGSGNPKDFEIQIRTTSTTGTTSFTGQLTYTVQGKFNSIT